MKRQTKPTTSTATTISAALLAPFLAQSALGVDYYWDNNGDTAGFGTAAGTWADPTVGEATQGFSTDATGATLPTDITTTGSDVVRFGSDTDGLAAGTVTVSGAVAADRVVFGFASSGVIVDGGSISLASVVSRQSGMSLNSDLVISGGLEFIIAREEALQTNIGGVISGNGDVTFTSVNANLKNNDLRYVLNGSSTYTGDTFIDGLNGNNRMRVVLGVDDALPTTTVVTIDGGNGAGTGRNQYLQLNGKNQTIAGLTNVNVSNRRQEVRGPGTLTINNTGDFTFSGRLDSSGAALNLVKTGSGTQTLTSSLNSYSGTTTISEGRLKGRVGGDIENSAVTLEANGIYSVDVTDNTLSWTCDSLTTTGAGTIEFDFGAVTPSNVVSPLIITGTGGVADFTTATPLVSVLVDAGLSPGTYPLATWDSLSGTAPGAAELSVSNSLPGTAADLVVNVNTLELVITSTAVDVVKQDNTDDLTLGSSWVGGVAPVAGDTAVWDNTVTGANSTVLGADADWGGIVIEDPAGAVSIGGANTLTLGGVAVEIDMATATADLDVTSDLLFAEDNLWSVASGRTLSVGGIVDGPANLDLQGDGTTVLSGANNYDGTTTVDVATLQLGASEVIPDGPGKGNVSLSGLIDMNGFSETVNGLTGSGVIDTISGGSSVLTVGNNDQSSTFNGLLQNTAGSLGLVKTGSGSLALTEAHTLSGDIVVEGGTLAFTNTNPFDNASSLTLEDGTILRPNVAGAVIDAPISLGGVGTFSTIYTPTVSGGATPPTPIPLTLNGPITGDGNVDFVNIQGGNAYTQVELNAPSTYTGDTLIDCTLTNSQILVLLGTENALPVTTVVTLDGNNGAGSGRNCDLNLNGNNQTLAGLTNVPVASSRRQRVNNTSATPATLTINNTADYSFGGFLGTGGSNLGLTKEGVGRFDLTGSLAYAGDTTVNAGVLSLGDTNGTNDASSVVIAASGATLELAFAGSDTVDTLFIGGVQQVAGTYGHTDSGADNGGAGVGALDAYFEAGTGSLTVVTGPPAAGYNAWAAINAGGQGPDLDFDGDGVPNGVEFFLDAAPGFTANPGLDASNVITWANGGNIPASEYGTQFVVQTSDDLVIWDDVLVGDLTENTDGPGGSLSYTLTGPAPRFVRLQVNPN